MVDFPIRKRDFRVRAWSGAFWEPQERKKERERLNCLTSPDPPKSRHVQKRHVWADQWVCTLRPNEEKEKEKKTKY